MGCQVKTVIFLEKVFLLYFIYLYNIFYSLLYFLYISINESYGIPNNDAISDLVIQILEANLKQASLQT